MLVLPIEKNAPKVQNPRFLGYYVAIYNRISLNCWNLLMYFTLKKYNKVKLILRQSAAKLYVYRKDFN